MLYNQHKTREMLRSILPSTGRTAARHFKKEAKRTARTNINQALRDFIYEDDWNDDSELLMRIHDQDGIQKSKIRRMVSRRRDADKINHFVRWAEHLTKDIDGNREKRAYFITHIGGSGDLIRDHAIGHFIAPWELNPVWELRWGRSKVEDIEPVSITRETFEWALTKAWDADDWDLDYIISPENDKGQRYFHHRREQCKHDKHACMKRTKRLYATVTSYEQEDGTRRKTYRSIDLTDIPRSRWHRHLPKMAAYYTTERYSWHHYIGECKNAIRLLEKKQIRGVVNYIFGRKKQLLIYSSKAKWWRVRNKRRLLQKFYEFFIEEGILQADADTD